MKSIQDRVFGNLQYNHSWEKEEDLSFRNEKTKIMVVVEAYTDQEILDIQRQQYLVYQQKKNEYMNKIPRVLLKYYLVSAEQVQNNEISATMAAVQLTCSLKNCS